MEARLELKHLAPYLPYELNGVFNLFGGGFNHKAEIQYAGKYDVCINYKGRIEDFIYEQCKPILRPLSDLFNIFNVYDYDKFEGWQQEWIDHMFDFAGKIHEANVLAMPYDLMELALEAHIDVFGLIDKGLAIDINTLE